MENQKTDHVRDLLVEQMEQLRRLADQCERGELEDCTVNDLIDSICDIADKIAVRDYIAMRDPAPQLSLSPLRGTNQEFHKLAEDTKARIRAMQQKTD